MNTAVSWDNLDWAALDRLRATFLSGVPPGGSYWQSPSDVATYDLTYAQRIGWKWDAVLRELQLRGWSPPPGLPILDWGCGSGIASRRVVEFIGGQNVTSLTLHDQSSLAVDYAVSRARHFFPALQIHSRDKAQLAGNEPVGILVISHVLNELTPAERGVLLQLAGRASVIFWVEPGTHAVSRDLIGLREQLMGDFRVIAPCTHQSQCGLLTPENERHWCHHFATPPRGIMADADWVRFAQRAGIDLRSLPYSFLVLERKDLRQLQESQQMQGWSRIIGEPRIYKGFAKIFSCQSEGVSELTLQKRDNRQVFKGLDDNRQGRIFKWSIQNDRITSVETLPARSSTDPDDD